MINYLEQNSPIAQVWVLDSTLFKIWFWAFDHESNIQPAWPFYLLVDLIFYLLTNLLTLFLTFFSNMLTLFSEKRGEDLRALLFTIFTLVTQNLRTF